MAYTKQNWIDHIANEQGEVIQQGTLMDAEHFNHMEEGIYNANAHADSKANPHNITPTQLGFGFIIFKDDEGYPCWDTAPTQ